MRRDGTGVGPFRVSTFTVLNVLTLFTSVLVSHSSVTSLKDNGVALLKDDGVSSLGNDSTDGRALMGRIKPVGEDWRSPKEYLLGLGESWERYAWDYSDDSEDDYLFRA